MLEGRLRECGLCLKIGYCTEPTLLLLWQCEIIHLCDEMKGNEWRRHCDKAVEPEKCPRDGKGKGGLQCRGLGRKGRTPGRVPGSIPLRLYEEGVMH